MTGLDVLVRLGHVVETYQVAWVVGSASLVLIGTVQAVRRLWRQWQHGGRR